MKSMAFNSGIPTAPDVKRLGDAVGVPAIGTVIEYKAVEDAIGSKRDSSRFRSVTEAWRKKLEREHNILVVAIANVGFKFATPSERVENSAMRFKSGLRKIRRAATIAEATPDDGLTPDEKRARAHIGATGAALLLMNATKAKEIKFP